MTFPYRLAAVDIDETLIDSDRSISEANRAALTALHDRGVQIMLASGRCVRDMLVFRRALGLGGLLVCLQGALVIDPDTGETLHASTLPASGSKAVIHSGVEADLTVFVHTRDAIVVNHESQWVHQHHRHEGSMAPQVADVTVNGHGPIFKVVWAGNPERIASLAETAAKQFAGVAQCVVTYPWYLEFTAAGSDKATGLEAAAKHLGIDRRQVLAFGDGNNDAPMLRWAGLGVAMPGGTAAAKAAANIIAPDGDAATALARVIEQILERPSLAAEVRT